jgi:CRP-like cAMP-binding protein
MNSMMENGVLANMPSNEFQRIHPYLKLLSLEESRSLFEKGEEIRHIYFPVSATISMRYVLDDDLDIELTSIGRRFMVGSSALNSPISLYSAIISVSGTCYQLPVDVFLQEFARMQYLYRAALDGVFRYSYHIAGMLACSKRHNTQKQLTRWILNTIETSGINTVKRTHAEIAMLLGMRREAVTLILNEFSHQKIVAQSRGSFTLLDKRGLERYACHCHWEERYRMRPAYHEGDKRTLVA